MSSPNDRRYAETHEWHLLEGDIVTIGLTRFAVNELTDITFVEIQEVGTEIEPNEPVGEIESVKATSELFSVVAGTIIEINETLEDDPGLVNRDPFGEGWLCKLKVTDPGPLSNLMDTEAYDSLNPVSQ